MKKIFVTLLIITLMNLIFCSTPEGKTKPQAQTETVETPPVGLNAFLGDMKYIIENIESVETFNIKIKQEPNVQNNIAGYPVVKKGANLNAEQIALLKQILLSESTYDFTKAKKNFILPEYAFVIKKGKDSFILLIDYFRNEFLFKHGNNEKKEDFDNAREKMQKITKALF